MTLSPGFLEGCLLLSSRPHLLCLSTSLLLCPCGQQVLRPFCLHVHHIQQLNLGMGTAKGKPTLGLHPPAVCMSKGLSAWHWGLLPSPGDPTHLRCFVFICRLNRASQTYFFPIHLTDQLLPSAVFYATVGPLVVYFAMHRLVIKPYLRAQKER